MTPAPEELAGAISGHRFDEAIPYLSEAVEWDLVGEAVLAGRNAVIDALRKTAAGLAGVRTDFTRFAVVAQADAAVVDSVAEYTDAEGGRTVVGSCDVYAFADGLITGIRSYNVEIG